MDINKRISKLRDKILADPEQVEVTEAHSKEFLAIYLEDRKFSRMDAESIRIMLRLNLRYRFVPLHQFGISIDL